MDYALTARPLGHSCRCPKESQKTNNDKCDNQIDHTQPISLATPMITEMNKQESFLLTGPPLEVSMIYDP